MNRRSLLIAVKLAITGALIAWLVSQADWATLLPLLGNAKPWPIVLAAGVHIVAFGLMNVRWWMLLRHLQGGIPFLSTIGSFWLGLFANNFLPSGVGGDAARIWRMRRKGVSTRSLIASTLVDRVLGLAAMLLIGASALLTFGRQMLPDWGALIVLGLVLGIPLGLTVLFWEHTGRLLAALERRFVNSRVLVQLLHMVDEMRAFRAAPGRILLSLLLTAVLQSLVVLSYFLIGSALGTSVALTMFIGVVPLVLMIQNLPVSIGGLGLREGAFVTLMVSQGLTEQTAIAISLLYLLIFLLITAPGGLVLLRQHPSSLLDFDEGRWNPSEPDGKFSG